MSVNRVYNFSSGPATLPTPVLLQAQSEMLDWHGTGMSVMEMSHRGPEFMHIIHQAEHDLRELMAIPDNYRVLFLQGGGHLQFSMVPLNLLGEKNSIDLVHTGHWSKLAMKEAGRYCQVNVIASGEDRQFSYIPDETLWQRHSEAAYLYFVSNETIGGVQFPNMPSSQEDVPLVCDMSSDFLSRPVDVSKFGLIYAGAQKNVGPAGLTMVIVRDDLLDMARPDLPTMMNYRIHAEADSLYNTPPTYAVYIASLVFRWLKDQGGLPAITAHNEEKAALLYAAIDDSDGFYYAPVEQTFRSKMNVVFRLRNESLNEIFLTEAKQHGLVQLKGHRVLGGMRASIYNAMPTSGVQALTAFMHEFSRIHCG